MRTSPDKEIRRIKLRHGAPEVLRVFLIEYEDLNFYHYGVVDQLSDWNSQRLIRAANELGSLRDCHDPLDHAIKLTADRAEKYCLGTTSSSWTALLQQLRTPSRFAETLKAGDNATRNAAARNLATLLHAIPQSPLSGVIAHPLADLVNELYDTVSIDGTAPWSNNTSTLALLRPLEYFFEIGSRGAQSARISLLRSETSRLPLGILINFSSWPIPLAFQEDLQTTIDGFHLGRVASLLREDEQPESIYHTLSRTLHHLLPIHSSFHWQREGHDLTISTAFGFPFKKRTTDPASVFAQRQNLGQIPASIKGIIKTEAQECFTKMEGSEARGLETPYGSLFLSPLPPWDFTAPRSRNPLDPSILLTLVARDRNDVLQTLLCGCGKREPSALLQPVMRSLFALNARRMSTHQVHRYHSALAEVPNDRWVYSQNTAKGLSACVGALQRSTSGGSLEREWAGFLFHGALGSGKSHAAFWIASQVLGITEPRFGLPAMVKDREFGETEKAVDRLIAELCQEAPAAILVDEMETLTWGGHQEALNYMTAASFKRALDTYINYLRSNPAAKTILIGTTNHLELIESAVRDRFFCVEFTWGPHEIVSLVAKRTANGLWTEAAREYFSEICVARSFSGRRITKHINVLEDRSSDGFLEPRRAISLEDLQAYLPLDSQETNMEHDQGASNDTGIYAPLGEDKSVRELLEGLLSDTIQNGWSDDSHLGDYGLDPNKISIVNRIFPAWAHRYRLAKSNNRSGPSVPLD